MTIDLTHFDRLRRLKADPELGTVIRFHAFGVGRDGIVVGRVGKKRRGQILLTAAADPVVAYRLPSHAPEHVELFRVLRNSTIRYINSPEAGVPNARRLTATELRTADLQGPALTIAHRILGNLVDSLKGRVKLNAIRGRGDLLAQAHAWDRRAAAWTKSDQAQAKRSEVVRRRIEELPGPTAAQAPDAAEVIGHPPLNAPAGTFPQEGIMGPLDDRITPELERQVAEPPAGPDVRGPMEEAGEADFARHAQAYDELDGAPEDDGDR